MVNPGILTAALVTKLQSIAALVTLLNGDATQVFVYKRGFPDQTDLASAIYRMTAPGVMVVWEGTVIGSYAKMECWRHNFALYLRAKATAHEDASKGFYDLWTAIVSGVPTDGGENLPMLRTSVHVSCFPMNNPTITPAMAIANDPTGNFEYWKVSLSFTEKGDF